MTTELRMLAFSVLLGLFHIAIAASFANRQRGFRWNWSARDTPMPPLTGVAARLDRAMRNYLETFTFFAAAVMLANLAGGHDWTAVLGAQLYFYGRLVYLPLYGFGVPYLRSAVWSVATLGIVMVGASAF